MLADPGVGLATGPIRLLALEFGRALLDERADAFDHILAIDGDRLGLILIRQCLLERPAPGAIQRRLDQPLSQGCSRRQFSSQGQSLGLQLNCLPVR